jgi:hypothetical protein
MIASDNDYKKYDMPSQEYYDNYVAILHDELNVPVKSVKIRTRQDIFRDEIIKKYQKCIISGIHYASCDAAHIYDLQYEENYSIHNGILLNKTLHYEFDELVWCINPDSKCIEINNKIDNYEYREIYKYIGKNLEHIIGNENMPYLERKYKLFIDNMQKYN